MYDIVCAVFNGSGMDFVLFPNEIVITFWKLFSWKDSKMPGEYFYV